MLCYLENLLGPHGMSVMHEIDVLPVEVFGQIKAMEARANRLAPKVMQ